MSVPAGWYPDPQVANQIRWWDGERWSEHVAPHVKKDYVAAAAQLSRKDARQRVAELEELVDSYGLKPVEEARATLANLHGEIAALQSQLTSLAKERKKLSAGIADLRDAKGLQQIGLYDFEHPAESSAELAAQLEILRNDIKSAIREKIATNATKNFTFNNSQAKGRKFVNDMSKVLLRAYNAEAENCVVMMKAGRLEPAQKRLARTADQIARQGKMINLEITSHYQRLRMRELELADRHLRAKQREKELEREHRAELREQRRVEKELAAAQAKLKKEREHYLATLAALTAQGDEDGMARMEERLADVDRAIADVDYRTANQRAGYVYVISNIGSFGENVVKIGLTRRLEPMDRVRELGDASVPFGFDVHALFFADDAVDIENMLHKHFADRRVNHVNLRREYFYALPEEVLDVLNAQKVELVEFVRTAEAAEFRQSEAIRQEAKA